MEGAFGVASAGRSGASNGPRYPHEEYQCTAVVRSAAMLMGRAGYDLDRSSQLIDTNYSPWALSSAPDYGGIYLRGTTRALKVTLDRVTRRYVRTPSRHQIIQPRQSYRGWAAMRRLDV